MMSELIESVQILRDAGGHPAFAVIPFSDYQALIKGEFKVNPGIPAAVVDLAMDNTWSAARAWREHKQLTQIEVAQRMGITQGAYAQLEAKKSIRKSSREKIALALGIHESQLDF
ncbi:helix-turn-helix transcriptional regulator [Xylella fastidiosa subsp. multiplex]|uniref:Helix-turn-helix transcriptional regulator n=4 Tax=Xylella fastidiosa TaxID=2371 RepID=A0A9Q4QSX2_XYLFS|nr:putative transcriptional regulator, XRE family [Xylella fastidiosa M12]MBE0269160.1 helix-turn-helix transcriptional regulator [Xylella fastidiosa subsp. multiplex]RWA43583.1 XRE family transcriptional regulator [Xylella fastidiosa subsp. sandyi]TNV88626.1 XRE family transcriptional regulator [Xylella fastidiosa]MBE0275818.1 helix-turn-helix transcriptional regulator [Xylella fastidiosa subsp. multiplex]